MVRRALARGDTHPGRAIEGLKELETYLERESQEFTPVQHAVASRKLRESSTGFKAVQVTDELDKGIAEVARINMKKRKSLPPKK
jgi:hypothetical protein